MANPTPDVLDALLEHLLETQYGQLPTATIQRVNQRLLDSVGVGLAGHRADDIAGLIEAAQAWGHGDEATVLGTGIKLPATSAAFVNAALIRSFDFEPVEAEGPAGKQVAAHISGTTVAVVLALAEATGATGEEALAALALGDDLAARLAIAGGFDVYSGQDNTGTLNALAAAGIASRMLGLDKAQARHAIGIAVNQASGNVAAIFDGANGFKLPMAFAARAGISAAQLAKAGMKAADDPLTGKHGYFQLFGIDAQPELAVADLGVSFHGDCTIKPFASCRAAQPSLQACAELVADGTVGYKDIECLTVHLSERTLNGFVGARFEAGDTRTVAALFSVHATAAIALIHGTVRPEHLTASALADPELAQMLGRIELAGTLPNSQRLTAEITARLRSGEVRHVRVEHPDGNILRTPLEHDQVVEKFSKNLEFSHPELAARKDALQHQLEHLASAPDLTDLMAALDPARNFTPNYQEQLP
ncbi:MULTISPECIES: MmgE/PrpD family protein [Micrococcaceae]|uniref:MmgE/PrpD family protein n=1 Tax=Micrococcaceae TaxID=1268 RepID=UPI000CFBFA3F|nr:MmgE/PrpD family protein [Arthrobacter sp. MYb222]PQZ89682.1 hypothetical protein CQ016_02130 [Arthrobacter sp. MYb222]